MEGVRGLLSPKSVEIIEREIAPGRIAPMALTATTCTPSGTVYFCRK